MVPGAVPVVLRGDDAIQVILSLALPRLVAAWDGSTDRVAMIEHDGEGTVRDVAIRSRREATAALRFRATQTLGATAEEFAAGAALLATEPPAGDMHVVIIGPAGCAVGQILAEQLRNPNFGPAPITIEELAALALEFQSGERALAALEAAQLLVRVEIQEDVPELAHVCRVVESRWANTSAVAMAIAKAAPALDALPATAAVARARQVIDALSIAIGQTSPSAASPMTRGGSA